MNILRHAFLFGFKVSRYKNFQMFNIDLLYFVFTYIITVFYNYQIQCCKLLIFSTLQFCLYFPVNNLFKLFFPFGFVFTYEHDFVNAV